MAIRSFAARAGKSLSNASYDNLPNLVVIAGPNGAGKSTLLYQLYERRSEVSEPGTRVRYVGPHRPWRKSTLTAAAAYANRAFSFTEYLEMPQLPGWEQIVPGGLQYVSQGLRLAESADEAQALVKYVIVKLEYRRLALLKDAYEQQGQQIRPDSFADIYEPLRRLTRFLLPHLTFQTVDVTNDRDIKCYFRRADGATTALVDIDDLSSGEKAVIALFLPFVEVQIETLITGSRKQESAVPTFLIDEPDIHLHPTLQVSLLAYMRSLADADAAQFIVATHSPAMLDALEDDELFVLAPTDAVGTDGNQFVRVSSSQERLEAMRSLTGATHLITRCRPIVFVEGGLPGETVISDQRLMDILLPTTAAWAVVPSNGRSDAITRARELRERAAETLPGIPVFALVDAEQGRAGDPAFAISWGAAMIENLLLDPEAIWHVLEPYREKVSLQGPPDIERELRSIARSVRQEEVRLRVLASTPFVHGRIDLDRSADADQVISDLRKKLATVEANEPNVRRTAEAAVDTILAEGRELEAFGGKAILAEFFARHVHTLGLARHAFAYSVAQAAAEGERARRLTGLAVLQIQRFVPPDLESLLAEAAASLEGPAQQEALEASQRAADARRGWVAGDESMWDPGSLRDKTLAIARAVGEVDLRRRLLRACVQIGVL